MDNRFRAKEEIICNQEIRSGNAFESDLIPLFGTESLSASAVSVSALSGAVCVCSATSEFVVTPLQMMFVLVSTQLPLNDYKNN